MRSCDVSVFGATTAVGNELIHLLDARNFPLRRLILLTKEEPEGKSIRFREQEVPVQKLTKASLSGIDLVFFIGDEETSKKFIPQARKSGAMVIKIGRSKSFNAPAVVPEVNRGLLREHHDLIYCPTDIAIQLGLVLKPLEDEIGIERVVVVSCQSVSDVGWEGMIELRRQSQAVLDKKEVSPSTFPWQIAFNLLPQVGEFLEDGDTETERDAAQEVKDILSLPNLAITITCIRVPVFVCHSLAINVELKNDFSIPRIREILRGFPGVRVLDDAQSGIYPKPGDLADRDEVFVGRIRRDQTVPYGVNLWSVSDNLRKGSALNAVQIAEILVEWLEGD